MMVPLDPAAARFVRAWLGPPEGPGLLALHHALVYHRPGLWGDAPGAPRGVLLVREGRTGLEAFGAGRHEPALGWLVGRRREFTLHAPEEWYNAARERLGAVDIDRVETWTGPGLAGPILPPTRRTTGATGAGTGAGTPAAVAARTVTGPVIRRLTDADAGPVVAALPPWALRGWRAYPAMIEHGAAFGVPFGVGLASVAWVFDLAENYDVLGVFTVPRFRQLGLGRAVVSALIRHVVRDRGRVPLWSTTADNEPSRGLARVLGFSVAVEESLLHWPPRTTPAT
jgi:GNAT superfamily N-acetyltransferase